MEPPPPASAEAVRAWDRPVVMLPVFVVIAAIGGLFGSFTFEANLYVVAVGGTLFWLGMTGRAGRRPAPATLPQRASLWLVPALGLALVELFAFTKHSLAHYPTISLLMDPILDGYLARSVFYFLWVYAFWGLVRR